MKLLLVVLALGLIGCSKKPRSPDIDATPLLREEIHQSRTVVDINIKNGSPDLHWDFCIQGVCFDRSDGKGHKQPFTQAEKQKVAEVIDGWCGGKK
jgi:hypothetical protein